MMQDEHEEYGEDARPIIEGLRHLARRVETPPDLAAQIRARGEQLLPPQPGRRIRWWTVVAAWRPPALAWGPIVAVAFFIAGALIPWPYMHTPLQDAVFEKRAAPIRSALPKEATEVAPASPAPPSQAFKQEMQPPTESVPPPPEGLGALARRAPRQLSVSTQITVTTTLPTALYAQLQQEAQRRQVSLSTIVREAVEAYTQSQPRQD